MATPGAAPAEGLSFEGMVGGYEECIKWSWDGKQSCKQVVALLEAWAAAGRALSVSTNKPDGTAIEAL